MDLPAGISNKLHELKGQYDHYIEVKKIHNSYCVFQSITKYDRKKKKSKKVTHYLGTIHESGEFVPAVHRSKFENVENGSGNETAEEGTVKIKDNAEERELDNKILTALSMNARIEMPNLGKLVGVSEGTARNRVEKLKKKYGISSTAFIDRSKLGYFTFISLIKFKDSVPNLGGLKEALENEPRILLAMFTKGDYDLMLLFIAEDNNAVSDFTWHLRKDTVLAKYNMKFYTSSFFKQYGNIPIRQKTFELLSDKAWHRTKENPRPLPGELTQREVNVLKELAYDGFAKFIDIDRKYGYEPGAAYHTYTKLRERNVIRRMTITIRNLPIKYCSVLLMEDSNGVEMLETRANLLKEIIDETEHEINKYALVGEVELPKGFIFIMPIFDENELMHTQEELQIKIKGREIKSLIATNIFVGTLCYERYDNTDILCSQYQILANEYKEVPWIEPKNYFDKFAFKKTEKFDLIKPPKPVKHIIN